MQIELSVVKGPNQGTVFQLKRAGVRVFGRSETAEFRLPVNDPYISREHFKLECNGSHCDLIDSGSANGTLVNGRPVERVRLNDGDEIEAGTTRLRVTLTNDDEPRERPSGTPERKQAGTEKTLRPSARKTAAKRKPPTPMQGEAAAEMAGTSGRVRGGEKRPGTAAAGWCPRGYVLLAELGTMGLGTLYQAHHLRNEESVTIRRVKPQARTNAREVRRFATDMQRFQRLNHPACVRLWDAGECEGDLYLVTEEFVGMTAAQWVTQQRGRLPIADAVRVMVEVIRGLGAAHRLKLYHLDLSPGDVWLSGEQVPHGKVANFGLTRAFECSPLSGLQAGSILGRPLFMAPEQLINPRYVSPTCDQYSAAVTLYWMLTGGFPKYESAPPTDFVREMLAAPLISIQARREEIPDGLADAIHRALSDEPEDRFDSVEEFARALAESCAAERPGAASESL